MRLSLKLPFARVPEWLLAVGREGVRTSYRIRGRWDGGVSLEEVDAVPPGKPCIAVLDPDLPYRRRLQRFPATARSRQALLKAAPDEFALPSTGVRHALGLRDGDGYLYALPESELDQMTRAGLQPVAVLVAAGQLDAAGCLGALETLDSHGDAVNFIRGRRLLARRTVRNAVLAALLLGIVGGAAQLLLGPDLVGEAIAWRAQTLRREAGNLPQLHGATETMVASREATGKLFGMPEAKAPAVLGNLLATVPSGHSIRRIEIVGGTLRVAGSGADVQDWLIGAGFPAEGITVEETGSFRAWRAERPL